MPIRSIWFLIFIVLSVTNCNGSEDRNGWKEISEFRDKLVISIKSLDSNIYVATGADVFMSANAGESWERITNDLSALQDITINLVAPMKVNDSIYLFAGTYRYGVLVTNNNGKTWNQMNNGIDNLFIFELAVIGNTVYANAAGLNDNGFLYRSIDYGAHWSKVNGLNCPSKFPAIAGKDNFIFVGSGCGIFRSTNNGNSFFPTDTTSNRYVGSIYVNVYDIIAGASDGVFLSTNNGNTWKPLVPQNFEPSNVTALVAVDSIIVANDYVSFNYGGTWESFRNGLPNNFYTYCLTISDQNLLVGNDGLWINSTIIKRRSVQ